MKTSIPSSNGLGGFVIVVFRDAVGPDSQVGTDSERLELFRARYPEITIVAELLKSEKKCR